MNNSTLYIVPRNMPAVTYEKNSFAAIGNIEHVPRVGDVIDIKQKGLHAPVLEIQHFYSSHHSPAIVAVVDVIGERRQSEKFEYCEAWPCDSKDCACFKHNQENMT